MKNYEMLTDLKAVAEDYGFDIMLHSFDGSSLSVQFRHASRNNEQ